MKLGRTTRIAIAAAALIAPAATFAPTAHAASACLENNTLTFSPPLTLANQAGTATLTYSNTCSGAPGLTASQSSGTYVTSYFGSCAAAIIAESTDTVVLSGVVYMSAGVAPTGVYLKAEVLEPNGVCPGPISSASGTGVVTDLP